MQIKDEYRTTDIPNKPGVYVFRDRFREVIYVGKAKSLRKRLSNYFQPSRQKSADAKLRSLINSIAYYEIYTVRTEEEAMLLESRFIKQYNPRYNVVLRDDKRFLLIKIDKQAPFPRLTLARIKKNDGCSYYGPFPQAGVLRDTVDFLTRHFRLRSCRPTLPGEGEHKHCLDHILRFCSAPCVQKISRAEYHCLVEQLVEVIEGKTDEIVVQLNDKMKSYSKTNNFEQAGKIRDIIENIKTVFGSRNRTFVRTSIARYPGNDGVLELQSVLGFPQPPKVIECFDISNLAGTFAVAAMVSFVDGAPARRNYRHFRIKHVEGIDDFAMMKEVVKRRMARLIAENRSFPDLLVVDGGLGQLHAGQEAIQELKIELNIIGLAKKKEEIFTLESSEAIQLSRHQLSLKLVQSIRDEAHRFANTYHRKLRNTRISDSLLDEIPGVGKKRKQELLKHFGSVKNLRRYESQEIRERIPRIGAKLAGDITQYINQKSGKRTAWKGT